MGVVMRRLRVVMLTVAAGIVSAQTGAAHAASTPTATVPVGRWRTVDDETHQPRAIIEIEQVGDQLQGRIVRIFPDPGDPPNPICSKCDGTRKDQPVVGMVFMWGLHREGDSWDGGSILDPETGGVYDASLKLLPDGQRLEVRGYLGLSLLGRTQTWLRDNGEGAR